MVFWTGMAHHVLDGVSDDLSTGKIVDLINRLNGAASVGGAA